MKKYRDDHIRDKYLPGSQERGMGYVGYTSVHGWKDYHIGEHLVVSRRSSVYDSAIFIDGLHTHDFFEVNIVKKGSALYITDEHEIVPAKNNIIILPPGVPHFCRVSESCGYERFIIYFSHGLFGPLGGFPAELTGGSAACCRVIDESDVAELGAFAENIIAAAGEGRPLAGPVIMGYVMQLFDFIIRRSSVSRARADAIPDNVRNIKRHIDDNFQNISKISEISAHVFYSREYISRVFKRYFNITVYDYLENKKINHAKQCLREGKSVAAAFGESGYNSISSFVRSFKKKTGQNPSQYRSAEGRPRARQQATPS